MDLIVVCSNTGCDSRESVYIEPSMVELFDLDCEVLHTECNQCRSNGAPA